MCGRWPNVCREGEEPTILEAFFEREPRDQQGVVRIGALALGARRRVVVRMDFEFMVLPPFGTVE